MRLALTITFALTLQATSQSPKKPNPSQLLADAKAAQQANDLPAAISDYRAFLELRPTSTEAHTNLGAALAQHGDYDQAIAQFEIVLPHTGTKQQPAILLDIGMAYYKKGDFARAKPQFQNVLDIAPGSLQAATLLGDCDLKLNDPAAALAVLDPHASYANQNPEYAYMYGLALIRTGHLSTGAEVMQHVAEAHDDPEVYKLAGSTFLDNGDFEPARRNLETARRLNPALPGIDSLVGIVRERSGDTFAAETAFRDALRTNPNDFNANLYLGALLLKRPNPSDAKPFLDRALEVEPLNPMALYESALQQSANQPETAIALFTKAAKEDPTWPAPHLQLAILYDRTHDAAKADDQRREAATLKPRPVQQQLP